MASPCETRVILFLLGLENQPVSARDSLNRYGPSLTTYLNHCWQNRPNSKWCINRVFPLCSSKNTRVRLFWGHITYKALTFFRFPRLSTWHVHEAWAWGVLIPRFGVDGRRIRSQAQRLVSCKKKVVLNCFQHHRHTVNTEEYSMLDMSRWFLK